MINSNMRRFSMLGTALLAVAFGSQMLHAATVYVGSCGSPTYSTIQKAVTAVAAGGTVNVCPGTYPEQVTITKNVNLVGVLQGTSDAVIITSPSGGVVQNTTDTYLGPGNLTGFPVAAQILVKGASSVNLTNITVDGSNNQLTGCGLDLRGIYYQNASGTINEVVTRNQILPSGLTSCQDGQGIYVQSGYSTGTANVTVEYSTVQAFQKNGITVDGPGASGNLEYNNIAGIGPTTGAAENGVQISDGAAGTVLGNVVTNNIWAPDQVGDTGDAASGILVYSSENVKVESNTVSTTQFGIVTVSDPTYPTLHNPNGLGDKTVIEYNSVLNTFIYDAIDTCSNSNIVENNFISNATESGIHLDNSCTGSGKSNVVSGNTIIESCAGVLNGGASNSIASSNKYLGVGTTILAGNVCPVPPVTTTASANVSNASTAAGRPTPVR